MRIVIQKVKEAAVHVAGKEISKIGKGVVVFFAVHKEDTPDKTLWLAQKLVHLRIFPDAQEKMNLSLVDVQGEALIVSQFTLYGSCTEGRRPEFLEVAAPEKAQPMYEKFVQEVKHALGKVATGAFREHMEVSLINDGPVTFIIESKP